MENENDKSIVGVIATAVGCVILGAIWGNGIEAPKGESDEDDISFSIDIERGSKTFHVRVMEW